MFAFEKLLAPDILSQREMQQAEPLKAIDSHAGIEADTGIGIGFEKESSDPNPLWAKSIDIKSIWKSLSSRLAKGKGREVLPLASMNPLEGGRRSMSIYPRWSSERRFSTGSIESIRPLPPASRSISRKSEVDNASKMRYSTIHSMYDHHTTVANSTFAQATDAATDSIPRRCDSHRGATTTTGNLKRTASWAARQAERSELGDTSNNDESDAMSQLSFLDFSAEVPVSDDHASPSAEPTRVFDGPSVRQGAPEAVAASIETGNNSLTYLTNGPDVVAAAGNPTNIALARSPELEAPIADHSRPPRTLDPHVRLLRMTARPRSYSESSAMSLTVKKDSAKVDANVANPVAMPSIRGGERRNSSRRNTGHGAACPVRTNSVVST